MDSLSMAERIAQIMMVPLYSRPDEPGSALEVSRWIEEHGVGGVIAMQGDKSNTRKNLAWLDSLAEHLEKHLDLDGVLEIAQGR